jgi:cytochrome c556
MKKAVIAFGSIALLIAGARAAGVPNMVVPLMKDVVAPQANVLWDVGNRGMDDDGNPDISKLKPADWANLAKASQAMKDAATAMAAPGIKAAPAGFKLDGEGSPGVATVAQIQAAIDKDPQGFVAHANALGKTADAFIAAAKAKDAKLLADASGGLDTVCEDCHMKYWYPKE